MDGWVWDDRLVSFLPDKSAFINNFVFFIFEGLLSKSFREYL